MPRPIQVKFIDIGGVKFREHQVRMNNSGTYERNGVKMYSVFLNNGVHLTFPDQTNPDKHPEVDAYVEDYWHVGTSVTLIDDIEHAVIYGQNNQHDKIELGGKSSKNTVKLEDYGNFFTGNFKRSDKVYFGLETEDNKAEMDSSDEMTIDYFPGPHLRSYVDVEAKGECIMDQEDELYDRIGHFEYMDHKRYQKEE